MSSIRWIVEDLNKYNLKRLYIYKKMIFVFTFYSYDGGILEYRIEKTRYK